MGAVLSISPRDRKIVMYNDNAIGPTNGFTLNSFSYKDHFKKKDKIISTNLDNKNVFNNHQNHQNHQSHHGGLKKSLGFINALHLGKHFSINREKRKAEKNKNLINQQKNQQTNDLVNNNSKNNIQKSLSCYNLKSGTTTNNIEIVKNINKDIPKDTPPPIHQLTIGKSFAPPPLPPKPTILLSKNSIRPSNGFITGHQIKIKNAISLTNNVSTQISPNGNQRKTVIQVS